jgi:hypothetical protein
MLSRTVNSPSFCHQSQIFVLLVAQKETQVKKIGGRKVLFLTIPEEDRKTFCPKSLFLGISGYKLLIGRRGVQRNTGKEFQVIGRVLSSRGVLSFFSHGNITWTLIFCN